MALFEVKVSNSINNQTQHVAGKFGTNTGASFVSAVCPQGTLCVKNGLIPSEGYESVVDANLNPKILNGNTWYFNAASTGVVAGMRGDHTGIYAFDNYDVNKVVGGGITANLGVNTYGISLPAGERGDFCEIIVGEQYAFDAENFSTAPTAGATSGYATISSGKLVYSADAPETAVGLYFVLLRVDNINVGTQYKGARYILEAKATEITSD